MTDDVAQSFTDVETPDAQVPPRQANPLIGESRPQRSRRTSRPGRPGAPTSRTARPSKPKPPDYTKDLLGLIQLGATPLFILGQRNRPLLADGVTVVAHAEPIAKGLNSLAQQSPPVAHALEALVKLGPYGALVEPLFLCGVQIMTNHRPEIHKITRQLGAKTVDELLGPERAVTEDGSADVDTLVPS